jgi:carotenoid cleavage dioxygenase-like enzyme
VGLENLGCASAGELFFIGYQMDKKPPCVWYSGLDKDGQLQFDVKVDLKEGVMMHDMAITQASSH